MDPFLGPVASALVAAVCAGTMLGLVRLSRVSLEWWRRRTAAGGAGGAGGDVGAAGASGAAAADAAPDPDDVFDAGRVREARESAFRDANLILGAAALAGAAGVAIALELSVGAAGGRALSATPPADLEAVASSLALAPLVLAGLVAAAFLLALADRGVTRLARRLGWATTVSELDVARWLEAARLLWPGGDTAERRREPVGVGLAYVALFAASAAAWAALLGAIRDTAFPPVFLLGPLLLVVPLAYAAAAERSQKNASARLRQAAAGRQLAVAPAWGMAIAATLPLTSAAAGAWAGAWALVALVLATPLALPGTAVGSAWANWPRGGDVEEPSVGVRALSAVAHYAWLGAIALAIGLGVAFRPGASREASLALALGVAAATALGVLALRVVAGRSDERVRRLLGATALAAGAIALAVRQSAGAP
jgi:hypothetical protein